MFPRCVADFDADKGEGEVVACLDPPGWSSVLGMVGVFIGLALVIMSEPTKTGAGVEAGVISAVKHKYEQIGQDIELT